MRILTDAGTFANLIDSPAPAETDAEARYAAFRADRPEPTEFALAEYRAWLRETDAEAHAMDEPTPFDLFEEPGDDWGEWWESLPTDPDLLDTPIGLGPEAELGPPPSPRFTVTLNGDPADMRHGYVIRDTARNQVPVRRARWLMDAEAIAADLNRNAARSRHGYNPEADAVRIDRLGRVEYPA